MCCIPCSACECCCFVGASPCSTFFLGNLPNNTSILFHRLALVNAPRQSALLILQQRIIIRYSVSTCGITDNIVIIPFASTQTISLCPVSSSDALPSASALPASFDIGHVSITSRRRPCSKIFALVCAAWHMPCTFCTHYSLSCCTAKRSNLVTNCDKGSSPPDHNSLLPYGVSQW